MVSLFIALISYHNKIPILSTIDPKEPQKRTLSSLEAFQVLTVEQAQKHGFRESGFG